MSTLGSVEIVKSRGRLRLEALANSPPPNAINIEEIDDIDNDTVSHGNGVKTWDETPVSPDMLWKAAKKNLDTLDQAESKWLSLPLDKQIQRLRFLLDRMIAAIEAASPACALGAIQPYDYEAAFLIECTGLAADRGLPKDARPVFDRVEILDSDMLAESVGFSFTGPYGRRGVRVNLDWMCASADPTITQPMLDRAQGEQGWRKPISPDRLAEPSLVADLLKCVKEWREYIDLYQTSVATNASPFVPIFDKKVVTRAVRSVINAMTADDALIGALRTHGSYRKAAAALSKQGVEGTESAIKRRIEGAVGRNGGYDVVMKVVAK